MSTSSICAVCPVAGVSSRLSTIEFGYPTLDARKEELQVRFLLVSIVCALLCCCCCCCELYWLHASRRLRSCSLLLLNTPNTESSGP